MESLEQWSLFMSRYFRLKKSKKKWKSQVYSQIINKGIDLEKSWTLKEIYIMWDNPIIKYLWVSEWAKLA